MMDINQLVDDCIKILRLESTLSNMDEIERLVYRIIEDIELSCNRDFDTEVILPKGLNSLIIDMVVFRYNIQGYEHLSSEGINEISRSFNTQYPDYINSRLKRLRRVRVV